MPEAVWNQPAEQPAAAKVKSCIINIEFIRVFRL